MLTNPRILIWFFLSFFLIVLSVILSVSLDHLSEKPFTSITIIILGQLGACIFFPLLVGYFYDKLKRKNQAETIWTIFKDLSDGGIIRVYMDREENEHEQNAHIDLRSDFDDFRSGEVKLVGVSLRVFFNQTGPFYRSIYKICELGEISKSIKIRALISHPESPEVYNRAKIETPNRVNDPLIKIDIKSTVASIENLNNNFSSGPIKYCHYEQAPYCTCIIFPEKCYFSPNILSSDAPVRLPMIVFQRDSHGYKKLNEYFEYLWKDSCKEKTPTIEVKRL